MEENTNAVEQPTVESTVPQQEQALLRQGYEGQAKVEKDTSADANIRALRESKARAERERDEALKLLQQAKKSNTDTETDDDLSVSPDDLVEGKHLNKYYKKMKTLEKQMQQYQQQNSDASAETRLRTEHNDFNKVVNAHNIELLRESYPNLAHTLNSSTDLYSKGSAAYTMIKELGIYTDQYDPDKKRALDNAAKPKPLTSINPQQGDSPLSHANAFANGLTDDLKSQLRKEMSEARKRR